MKHSEKNAEILGLQTILFQTQEECAELIKAISKYNRVNGIGQRTNLSLEDALSNLYAEIADVLICVEGLEHLLSCHEIVDINKEIALNKRFKEE